MCMPSPMGHVNATSTARVLAWRQGTQWQEEFVEMSVKKKTLVKPNAAKAKASKANLSTHADTPGAKHASSALGQAAKKAASPKTAPTSAHSLKDKKGGAAASAGKAIGAHPIPKITSVDLPKSQPQRISMASKVAAPSNSSSKQKSAAPQSARAAAVAGVKPSVAKNIEPKGIEQKSAAAPALDAAKFQAQRQAALKPAATRAMPAAVANTSAQRISALASPAATAPVVNSADVAQQAQQALAAKKPISIRHGFKTNEWIVYPAHGVGRIIAIEEQEIAGMALELFVITFDKDKMTLRVPTGKSASVGMRKLAEESVVKRAMDTLKGKARIKRTMWSRRAQEFEQKINSGDLVAIAEVVRDLFRAETQPEQSYSERQLYEAALDRMAREIAAVEKIDERGAVQRITEVLSKSAKTRRAETEATNGDTKAA